MPIADQGSLSLLTYNIAGLPEFISSAKTPRKESIGYIGSRLMQYDLVNLQEDFNYHQALCETNQHPYRTTSKGGVPFGDGLSTLSNYPIIFHRAIAWDDCSGADCLTPKGFSLTQVLLAKDVVLDVYNVHATAEDNRAAVNARRKNFQQLQAFIQQHSQENPLLIMGDFNTNYKSMDQVIPGFVSTLNLRDAWLELIYKGKLPEHGEVFISDKLKIENQHESIDKIFFRNGKEITLHPVRYAVEKSRFVNLDNRPLSDHCPIALNMRWERLSSL